MSDIICANCRGESTVGCSLCNPPIHPTVSRIGLETRIAELQAEVAALKALLEEHGVTFDSNETDIADYNAGEFYK